MHSMTLLPEGYGQILEVNLQKDKKTATLINVLGVLLMALMGVPMHFVIPISTLFDMSRGLVFYFLRLGVLMIGYVLYIIAHEETHAVVMRHFGAKKVRFGFTGMYAFAGSEEDYFDKHAYIRVALAPLVVWGVILTVLCLIVPRDWFWVVYAIQIGNVAGAMGDLYVTFQFAKLPADILVRDTGIDMTVYSRETP